jgi:hypothetical protein
MLYWRQMHVCKMGCGVILGLSLMAGFSAEIPPDADRWLTNPGARPERFLGATVATNVFTTLRAEVVAGALQVKCEGTNSLEEVQLVVSADAPGHWPARDWRTLAMRRAGSGWLAEIPVDSADVPQIYFVAARLDGRPVISPMRLAHPRTLGLERPTRLFWAFVEGFEQDLDGWRTANAAVRTNAAARSGRAALSLRVPAGQKSVSVESTRLRGWFLQEHEADGFALWLRMGQGEGRVAFTLVANAGSTNQITSRRTETVAVSTNWAKARLLFESFPKAPLAELDLIIIKFIAAPGAELLIDDVHLLGRWRENF